MMKRSQSIQGAGMILVVLITMLLMAALLAATLQIGLSSRQSTADQGQILPAQYAAESQVSLARSRFRDIQRILSAKDSTGTTAYIKAPLNTSQSALETYALQFCGKLAISNPWQDTTEFSSPRSGTDVLSYTTAKQCVVDSNSTLSDSQYGILTDFVQTAAFNELPAAERPSGATSNSWWASTLSFSNSNLKYKISPLRVVKLNSTKYRFYFGVSSLGVKGTINNGSRYIAGKYTTSGDWWFDVEWENPFNYVMFLERWYAADGGLFNDTFKGDIFTNEKIRFLFNRNTVNFKGNAFSAGCSTHPTDPTASCSPSSGFYGDINTLVTSGATGAGPQDNDLMQKMKNQGATFAPNKIASFSSPWIPLPDNANDQQAAAIASGIILLNSEVRLEMAAGDSNGNPLSSYNNSTSKWSEPNPTYQYIKTKNSSGTVVNQYRYGSDNILYKKDLSTGVWGSTGKTFNGVIYSTNSTSLTNPSPTASTAKKLTVAGPDRIGGSTSTTADVSKMPPALASFAKINVAVATGGSALPTPPTKPPDAIILDSDLTMSDTPCDNDNSQAGCPKSGVNNILSLFTPSGNITMSTNTYNEATYHAAINASNGAFNVTNYNKRPIQGMRHVIGSVVEQRYGLNGVATTSGSITSGYGDDFSYDSRLRDPTIIPFSPIVNTFVASDASILNTDKKLDNIIWTQGSSGGF